MVEFYEIPVMNWNHGIDGDVDPKLLDFPDVSLEENVKQAYPIERGDLVGIPAANLLGRFYVNEDEPTPRFAKCLMKFEPKRLIYGAVCEKVDDHDGTTFFVVDWAADGLYRDKVLIHGARDMAYIKRCVKVYGYEIQSFTKGFEVDKYPNLYTRLFFKHSPTMGYTIRSNFFEERCKYCIGYKKCARKNDERVQMAMWHLYIDLSLKKNKHLSNGERRHICCTYYTALTVGICKRGVRYPVDECVRAEMKQLFPDETFTEFKKA